MEQGGFADASWISREYDPSTLIQNVSTINGNYSDHGIDLSVSGPDSLVLSRAYNSNAGDSWRFLPHCYLYVEKDLDAKRCTIAEGAFERTIVYVGANSGSTLRYAGWKNISDPIAQTIFELDLCVSNTAT